MSENTEADGMQKLIEFTMYNLHYNYALFERIKFDFKSEVMLLNNARPQEGYSAS